jgi:hypothetical protein
VRLTTLWLETSAKHRQFVEMTCSVLRLVASMRIAERRLSTVVELRPAREPATWLRFPLGSQECRENV